MFKVVIVDDEPLIREGLKTLVPWESYDFTIVDIAKNGKDALEKYEIHKPNLMVVDIRMPGMDGLELIENIRRKDSSLHFLILSGYADFEYAKRAIVCNVDGYIVKPVDEDELSSYLEKVSNMLKKESELKHTTELETEWRHDHLVQYLLSHEKGKADQEFKQKLERSDLLWSTYQPVVFQLYAEHDVTEETIYAIKESLSGYAEKDQRGIVFSRDHYVGMLLRTSLRTEQASQQLYHDLSELISKHGVGFNAALGEPVKSYLDISKSFEQAIELLRRHFLYKKGRWITAEGYPLYRTQSGKNDALSLSMHKLRWTDFIMPWTSETRKRLRKH
ncbi:response regulator [Marinicrinis lubricantis]|uniref:Response regulator n=1 Tax=Marinicrinis lubricantis TaxID=2086470 RepID=A0ABW1IL45_9BACL